MLESFVGKRKKISNESPPAWVHLQERARPHCNEAEFHRGHNYDNSESGEGFNESQQGIKSGITSFLLKTENPRLPFPRETGSSYRTL